MNGFKFNGKHCFKDFGLVIKSKNRPILPEPKIIVEEAPCMDGEYDFTEANPDSRTKYKPRTIEIDCSFLEKNMKYIRIKAHQIASWLACGEKELIFDDETAVFYLGRVVNKLDLENVIGKIGRFTLQFKCRPFAFSRFQSNEPLQRGMGLMRGYGLRRDMSPTIFQVSGNMALSIYNPGTYVKPVIRINGSFSTISFTANGKTISYNAALFSGQIEIDCEKMRSIKDGTLNVNNNTSGQYIEFGNGTNTLQISGTGLNCTVTLIFRYMYL